MKKLIVVILLSAMGCMTSSVVADEWVNCNGFKSKYTFEERIAIIHKIHKKEPDRIYTPCTDLNPYGDSMIWVILKTPNRKRSER